MLFMIIIVITIIIIGLVFPQLEVHFVFYPSFIDFGFGKQYFETHSNTQGNTKKITN